MGPAQVGRPRRQPSGQLALWPGAGGPEETCAGLSHRRDEWPRRSRGVEPLPEPVLALPWTRQQTFGAWLAARLGCRVRVIFNRNRHTMLSVQSREGVLCVRLHHMFRRLSWSQAEALARYLAGHRGAGRVVDAFIAANSHTVERVTPPLRSQGQVHDLAALMGEVNATYFHGACQAAITWGQRAAVARKRSLQLGCYVEDLNLIRIHPCLDQAFVPRFYVAWVVFHEMLHEVFGVEEVGGRRSYHPPAFVALEQSHPDYGRAKAWEQRHLGRLLRYRGRAAAV